MASNEHINRKDKNRLVKIARDYIGLPKREIRRPGLEQDGTKPDLNCQTTDEKTGMKPELEQEEFSH